MSELTAPVARPGIPAFIGSWPQSRFWLLCVDLYPALAAASLPWSTTAVSVFMALWMLVVLPTIRWQEFLESLRAPASFLPLAFVALAIAGLSGPRTPGPSEFKASLPVCKAAGRSASPLSLRTLPARALGVVRVPGFLCPPHGIVMGDILRRLETLAGWDSRCSRQKLHRSKPRIRVVPVCHGAADPVIRSERSSGVDLRLRSRHVGLLPRHAVCRDLAHGISSTSRSC